MGLTGGILLVGGVGTALGISNILQGGELDETGAYTWSKWFD